MTRKELAHQIKVFEKWNRKAMLPFLGVLLSVPLVFTVIAPMLTPEFKRLLQVLAIIWLFGTFYIFSKIIHKKSRTLNLYCPSCNAPLGGLVGKTAVTTLYCGNCGEKIVEEDQDF